ncbi:MAG: hypothetical protein P4L53_27770 [Candidatus Obscuribacterales bacterium]|nr:hypothetical protein [Candidatus Obscuribacterales bacterium]
MRILSVFLLVLFLGGTMEPTLATQPSESRRTHGNKANSPISKVSQSQPQSKPADTIIIRPNKNAETGSAKVHAFNSFSDMTQSMPAQAVKEELVRKRELPGQRTSVLTPGDASNTSISSPTLNNATTGAAPRIESGSGMSIPQPTGGSSSVFK